MWPLPLSLRGTYVVTHTVLKKLCKMTVNYMSYKCTRFNSHVWLSTFTYTRMHTHNTSVTLITNHVTMPKSLACIQTLLFHNPYVHVERYTSTYAT